MLRAVFFDVDFTLIYPGPTFRGEGYQAFCARHGIVVDATRFERAVVRAAVVLDSVQDELYNDELFIRYTRRIIEGMGGTAKRSTPARARSTRNGRPTGTSSSTRTCRRRSCTSRRWDCASA